MSLATPLSPVAPPEALVGRRVVLRRHDAACAPAQFAAVQASRAELEPWMPWVEGTRAVGDTAAYCADQQRAWEEFRQFDFGIRDRVDDRYLGNVGVHHLDWTHRNGELGYWLRTDAWGHGLMTEAASLLRDALFDLGLARLEIRCDPNNLASAGVAERLGFAREGVLRSQLSRGGLRRDTAIYASLAGEHEG